jgi:hypothetical protein
MLAASTAVRIADATVMASGNMREVRHQKSRVGDKRSRPSLVHLQGMRT